MLRVSAWCPAHRCVFLCLWSVLFLTLACLPTAAHAQPPADLPRVESSAPPRLLAHIAAIAVDGTYSCALTANGSLKCWGTPWVRSSSYVDTGTAPTLVVRLASGVVAVDVGPTHACVVTTAGGVQCWGDNAFGQLGDGTTTSRSTPVTVMGLATGVIAVSTGEEYTCALTATGVAKCWGRNSDGRLGNGTTTDQLTPVDVVGLAPGVTAITTGYYHTCAVTAAGGVKCWGANNLGQLGNRSTTDQLTPVDVVGLATGVATVSAGYNHTCALTAGGAVKCWGHGTLGQLGDGTWGDDYNWRLAPGDVVGLSSGVAAISAGFGQTCAVTSTGAAKCWGDNSSGQLGDGTTRDRNIPVDVVGLTTGVAAISTGGSRRLASGPRGHTCALTATGGVKCWGNNWLGQLGDGIDHTSPVPIDAVGLTSGVTAIRAGGVHACTLTTAGGIKCWGGNVFGQLGDGTTVTRATPVDVVGLTTGVVAISAGDAHTCALTTAGGVQCWGYSWYGVLGDGNNQWVPLRTTPVNVIGLTAGVTAISAGTYHTCALTTAGGVKCWGRSDTGRLGDGDFAPRTGPVDVVGLATGVAAIGVGFSHSCALTKVGGVQCWGGNSSGQLGDGTTGTAEGVRLTPVGVVGLTTGVVAVSAGGYHTCALTSSGGVQCWGDNSSGQLGDGTTTNRKTPVDVVGLTGGVTEISAGDTHTCAVTRAGGVKCWGSNGSYQLGDGTTTTRATAVDVVGLSSRVTAVSVGGTHTCALTTTGGVQCWGSRLSSQLGDGTSIVLARTTPGDVVDPGLFYIHLPQLHH